MTDRAALDRAIEIFRELGWDRARLSQTPDLPLGTTEQQRDALAGLRSGDWREFVRTGANQYRWISHVPVDHRALGVFAARVGVDARRTVAVLPVHSVDLSDEDLARMLIPRGPAFASQFVKAACVSSRRGWEHASSTHGEVAVRLAHAHDLAVPESVEYLKDWVVCAALALDRTEVIQRAPHRAPSDVGALRRRYPEHVRAAVGVGLPVTGPFGSVFGAAVKAGWLERIDALDLAFLALDAAQRPGDRRIWTTIITDELAVTDQELAPRADALVPVLSSGDGLVTEAFAPRLIATVPQAQLLDLLSVALLARTKKSQRAVLAAVAARPRPSDAVVADVAPLLAPLAADGDRQLARTALAALAAWGEESVATSPAQEAPPSARGLWQLAPPAWQVPRFEIGEISTAALTDAAAVLTGRPSAADIETERFLALANAVARRDPSEARVALRGVTTTWEPGLQGAAEWVAGDPDPRGRDVDVAGLRGPLEARGVSVFLRLGEVPMLLSTPTWVDMRIHPADLLGRLRAYADARADALEADLQLALLRTDVTLADAGTVRELKRVRVPVRLQSGQKIRARAGRIAAAYLTDPVLEPQLELDSRWRTWRSATPLVPRSLGALPARVPRVKILWAGVVAEFPTWGEAGLLALHHSEVDGIGIALRQAARRAAPLPPGAAANMLGAQRSFHPAAAADGSLAVVEAWQRGLLRETDIRYLDGRQTPSSLAALARALLEVAEQGMASLAWSVLDAVVTVSAQQPKLLAGTAEVIGALATLQPEARAAVGQGLAEPSVLDLPGVRAIAARGGSSRAVELARSVAASLPDALADPQELSI